MRKVNKPNKPTFPATFHINQPSSKVKSGINNAFWLDAELEEVGRAYLHLHFTNRTIELAC